MTKKTPDYREILRLYSENEYSQQEIADSVGSSKRTVNKTLKLAHEYSTLSEPVNILDRATRYDAQSHLL